MASLIQRGKTFSVVYNVDGKQKWESFKTEAEADKRKLEIEYQQMKGTFVAPNPTLLMDFLNEYVEMYGTTKWSHSTYSNHLSLIRNYITPNIGQWKMKDITTKKMDAFFNHLKTLPAVWQKGKADPGLISDRCIYDINLLLSNAFDRAVDWEYVGKNPVTRNACPERKDNVRRIWDPETAKQALTLCRDLNLLACMHLAYSCTMRIGEVTGLCWQYFSFGDVENGFKDAHLIIDAQLQRISVKTYNTLGRKQDQIKLVFPSIKKDGATILVLKTLKTDASRRVIWIPQTTAAILWKIKKEQDKLKEALGDEYQDFDLVIAQRNGRPVEGSRLDDTFKEYILDNGFPEVEFHSLRHLSTTVKLILSQGDIKAVQGETGHTQAKMVTDTYSHIIDQNRKTMAQKFDAAVYGNGSQENSDKTLEQLLALCAEDPAAMNKLRSIFAPS